MPGPQHRRSPKQRTLAAHERERLGTFLGWLRETPKLWRSADLRVVAAKIDKRWHFLGGSCWLRYEGVTDVPRVTGLPSTDHIWAFQIVAPLRDFRPLVLQVLRDSLTYRGRRVWFRSPDMPTAPGQSRSVELTFQPMRATRRDAALMRTPFVYAHTLQFGGESAGRYFVHGGLDGLNDHLRALAPPWNGFAELLRHGLASGYSVEHTSNVTLDVVAPVGLLIDGERCRLADGKLRITVLAETESADRYVSLTYVLDGTHGRNSSAYQPTSVDWKYDGHRRFFEFIAEAGDAREATIYLRLNGVTVMQASFTDSTQRTARLEAARAVFVSDTEAWERTLLTSDGETSGAGDGREFEHAAARLFSFLGFAVAEIGHTKGSQPDFLASAAGYPLLVVECTTGSMRTKSKLANIVLRSANVRDALAGISHLPALPHLPFALAPMHQTWRQQAVIPVMISSLPSSRVSDGERTEAGRDSVSVVDRSDLAHLLEFARRGESIDKVYEHLQARITREVAETPSRGRWR